LAHLRFFNFGWHIQHWPLIIAVELVVLNSIVGFILSGDQNTRSDFGETAALAVFLFVRLTATRHLRQVNAAGRPYAACPRWTIADRFLKPNRIREHEAVPKRHANRPNRLVRVSNSSLREVAVERCKPERVHSIEA
jgi:hypothetical protein